MINCTIYARYSTTKQNAASIEDQFRICNQLAHSKGLNILKSYQDAADSGTTMQRQGLEQLLKDAENRQFQYLIIEALDRLSRNQADIAKIFETLSFYSIKILSHSEGEISDMHIGLKGTMNALYIKDLAHKTHRRLRGRVENGKSAGGHCYGYDYTSATNENGERIRGERVINKGQAAIILRIMHEYAIGKGPLAIAKSLNSEGIKEPRGKEWRDTTIRGHIKRGTGILNNELYIGQLVWNRMHYIKHPDTKKRISTVNNNNEIIKIAVPNLRIVSDKL